MCNKGLQKKEEYQQGDTIDRFLLQNGSFDQRHMELKRLDELIKQLKASQEIAREVQNRIEKLEKLSRDGWHCLYIDIINREG
jgi:hypothetical protein